MATLIQLQAIALEKKITKHVSNEGVKHLPRPTFKQISILYRGGFADLALTFVNDEDHLEQLISENHLPDRALGEWQDLQDELQIN